MSDATPIEIIRNVYAAFASADLAALLELSSPDVVVSQDPALPWGGRHVGHQGVTDFASRLITAIDSTVRIDELFQAGADVVQHGRSRGTVRANGAAFDIAECHVWTVDDGRVVRARFFIDSAAMLSALAQ